MVKKCFGEPSHTPTFLLTLFPLSFTFSDLLWHSSFIDSLLGACYVSAPWNTGVSCP